MEENQVKEIINDPQKILNLLRLFHQLLHIYDQKEMEKENQKDKQNKTNCAGLTDTISIILKDNNGNIKKEIK